MNTHTSFKAGDSSSSFLNRLFDIIAIGAALYLSLKLYGQVVTTSYIMLYFTVMAVYLYAAESVQLYRSWRVGSFSHNIFFVALCLFLAFSAMLLITFCVKKYRQLFKGGLCRLVYPGILFFCTVAYRWPHDQKHTAQKRLQHQKSGHYWLYR